MATRECGEIVCIAHGMQAVVNVCQHAGSPPRRGLRHAALGLDRRHLEFGRRNGAAVKHIGKDGVLDLPKPDALAVLVRVLAALRMWDKKKKH
jgi:hypothetical protein